MELLDRHVLAGADFAEIFEDLPLFAEQGRQAAAEVASRNLFIHRPWAFLA
jgi:hypothetical protein